MGLRSMIAEFQKKLCRIPQKNLNWKKNQQDGRQFRGDYAVQKSKKKENIKKERRAREASGSIRACHEGTGRVEKIEDI